ncbi:hypothetical protein AJ80_06357 [Polytolypa hystricis UAMH7299]|uniref:Acyl-protein thioesterase 1 n=1 Tax=Polytolypa hystricis (strain UAMH7299) TaxID=1447883 RepID=A0A2B7XX54_POLH7|nr:hypothetical protein AJ80_06357 [Polytolypa hystricis UAMH7299]
MDLDEFMKNQDEAGMLKSRGYFNRLIKEEMDAGIPPSRIVMGGFSQGGAMALLTGITHPEKLGGIFALSCYTPLSNKLKDMLPESWPNKNVPVFVAHGDIDQVVRFELGQRSAQFLKDLGMNVDFRKYPDLGHAGRPDVTSDLAKYIRSILPPVEKKAQRPNGA